MRVSDLSAALRAVEGEDRLVGELGRLMLQVGVKAEFREELVREYRAAAADAGAPSDPGEWMVRYLARRPIAFGPDAGRHLRELRPAPLPRGRR